MPEPSRDTIAAFEGSKHFTVDEFRCHHCGRVKVAKELIWRLEFARTFDHQPLHIVSGYRCRYWQSRVHPGVIGQHPLGRAADLPRGRLTVEQAKIAGFTGIGYDGIWAVHVDVRTGRPAVFHDA